MSGAKSGSPPKAKGPGAPKRNLDPLWEEHQRRRANGEALLILAQEVRGLVAWANENLPPYPMKKSGTERDYKDKSISNRLKRRLGGTAEGYTRDLISFYLQNCLAKRALETWRAHLAAMPPS